MTYSDYIQIVGAAFILAGYWLMAKSVKGASASLVIGCAVWAYWAIIISPAAYWMFGLEVLLGVMSARTFWINRRA